MSEPDHGHASMFTLVAAAALIALTVSYTVDASTVPNSSSAPKHNSAQFAKDAFSEQFGLPTAAASAVVVNQVAAYRIDQGVVKFFFAPGKADLVRGAEQALQDIVQAAQEGKRVQISGYHDATGDANKNAELAKQRALTVQKKLMTLGVPEQGIALKKPEATVILGSYAEARRVEVTLVE